MATESGRQISALTKLVSQPTEFNFFQAVRLLEQWSRQYDNGDYTNKSVGASQHPQQEALRFCADPSLKFPTADINKIQATDENASYWRFAMTVTFMGLTGPQGVLPRHYTSLLVERMAIKDKTLQRFFDMFNHRAISLFYRAWAKNRSYMSYESSRLYGEKDSFSHIIHALTGIGLPKQRQALGKFSDIISYYSGYFSRRVRSAANLSQMLRDYLQLPVKVEQFQGQWLVIPAEQQSRLVTQKPGQLSGYNRLGRDAVAGDQSWSIQNKIRIIIGSISSNKFNLLLNNKQNMRNLCQLAQMYIGDEFNFDVKIIIRADNIPPSQLRSQQPFSLGRTTWLPPAHKQNRVYEASVVVSPQAFEGNSLAYV